MVAGGVHRAVQTTRLRGATAGQGGQGAPGVLRLVLSHPPWEVL